MNRTLLIPLVALSLLLFAGPARAAGAAPHSSSAGTITSLSFWGVADSGPWNGHGYGAGFRLTAPIVPQGVLHARVRDEFVLEFGADFLHYEERFWYGPGGYYYGYSWNGVLAEAGLAWNFWFTPQFALYPKIDLGWRFGSYSRWDGRYGGYYDDFDGVFLQLAGGLIYRFPSRFDLRVELGTGLARIGIGIPF